MSSGHLKPFVRKLPSGRVLMASNAVLLHRVADMVWLAHYPVKEWAWRKLERKQYKFKP